MQTAVPMLLSFWLRFKRSDFHQSIPCPIDRYHSWSQHPHFMAFPSQAFCSLSSPPCFSDHHLVSSFCYCTVFPRWLLLSLAGICSSPETKTRSALGEYMYFSFPCAHISQLHVGIYFLSPVLPQHPQRTVSSVIILTPFCLWGME